MVANDASTDDSFLTEKIDFILTSNEITRKI